MRYCLIFSSFFHSYSIGEKPPDDNFIRRLSFEFTNLIFERNKFIENAVRLCTAELDRFHCGKTLLSAEDFTWTPPENNKNF